MHHWLKGDGRLYSQVRGHTNPSTALISVTSIVFLQLKRLHVLYRVSPSLFLSSASHNLCRHNSFHAAFILSSHHMNDCAQHAISIWPLSFCEYLMPSQRLSDDLIPFLIHQRDSKYPLQHSHFC